MPSTRCLGAIDDLDDAAGVADRHRRPRRSPRPAAARGRRRRRSRSASPGAARAGGSSAARRAPPRPIRSGLAISSPSRSRVVISASTTCGSVPGWCSFLRAAATWPSSASSRSMRLSAARSAFFRPKARAISRVPTLPGCLPMKARISSLVGRATTRGLERGGLERGRFTVCGARYGGKLSTSTPSCHPARATWHSWRPSAGPSLEPSLGPALRAGLAAALLSAWSLA